MNPPARARASQLPLFAQAVFFLCAALWLASLLRIRGLADAPWPAALFLLAALAATLVCLTRTLPVQNVLMAAGLIALMASVVEIVNVKSGIPFGNRIYTGNFGPRWLGMLPWPVPFIWVVAILNSRGVARLILRPWRKMSKYGLWVIGLTAMLTVVLDLSLEPFASGTNHFWIWQMPKTVFAWQTAPVINFSGWLVVAILILAFTTPWLINKSPSRSAPPDYFPLAVWLLLNLLPAVGCAMQPLWSAVALAAIAGIAVATLAIRGARW